METLAGFVAYVDPDAIASDAASGLWLAAEHGERLFGAVKVLLARRIDDSQICTTDHHVSPLRPVDPRPTPATPVTS
jgi:hypothetical protein